MTFGEIFWEKKKEYIFEKLKISVENEILGEKSEKIGKWAEMSKYL